MSVGRQLRTLRSLEARLPSSPGAVGRDVPSARREVIRDSRGVAMSPAERRIDRQLGSIGARAGALSDRPPATTPRGRAVPSDLPSSFDRGDDLPSSYGAGTVGSLLDRADRGLAAGRVSQARSDLSTADSTLRGLSTADASQAELDSLSRRLNSLQQRASAAAQ